MARAEAEVMLQEKRKLNDLKNILVRFNVAEKPLK